MTAYFRPIFIFFLSSLILSGCTTIDTSTTNVEWQTHQQRLASIDRYSASGKLGYISPAQRQSLNFHWRHQVTLTQLRLTTFIGQTALNMKIDASGSSVETYDGDTFYAHDAQALVKRLTGLALPVEQLNDWFLGRPTGADQHQLNPTHTLASLTKTINDKSWHLEYLNYQDITYEGTPLPLPQKLKLRQGEISINMVITNWNLEP
ncbi:lipoprotein insertase outer membrane protein LolB [Vibrio ostreicida]|uniref:lipoprotein insertase outer membrane protein LolB n=1 Tax=Vibrio ostreicida TaxID=526588 RepID=UPI0009702F18|nr:lipoprotein insertase outer membrane protein LolB [Vibrio ostreicida]